MKVFANWISSLLSHGDGSVERKRLMVNEGWMVLYARKNMKGAIIFKILN